MKILHVDGDTGKYRERELSIDESLVIFSLEGEDAWVELEDKEEKKLKIQSTSFFILKWGGKIEIPKFNTFITWDGNEFSLKKHSDSSEGEK